MTVIHLLFINTGADPGFLEGGFKFIKGGSFSTFYLIFLKIPHDIKIIWFQRGVQVNHPNPLYSTTVTLNDEVFVIFIFTSSTLEAISRISYTLIYCYLPMIYQLQIVTVHVAYLARNFNLFQKHFAFLQMFCVMFASI